MFAYGPYRTYEYDVTKIAEPGKPNVIAVEVSAPDYNDLGINWVGLESPAAR